VNEAFARHVISLNWPLCLGGDGVLHVTDCKAMPVSVDFRETFSANVFPMVSGSRNVHTKLISPHIAIIAPMAQLPKDASSAAAIGGGTAPPRIPPVLNDNAAPV
jgi:hypothetical protein